MQNLNYLVERDEFVNQTNDLAIESFAPLTLCWNLTYDCNMECPHCLAPSTSMDGPDDHRSILNWLRQWRGIRVVISGGEPCLRPEILGEILTELKAMGHYTLLSTNGTKWDVVQSVMSYLDWIDISFTGTTAEIYSHTRPLDAYYLSIDCVKRALDSSLRVRISYTVMDYNYNDAFEFPQFVIQLGGRHARVGRVLPWGVGAKYQSSLSTQKLETLARHLITFQDQLRIVPPRIGLKASEFIEGYPVISSNGNLYSGIVSKERLMGHVSKILIGNLPLSVKNLFHANRLLFEKY